VVSQQVQMPWFTVVKFIYFSFWQGIIKPGAGE
jgi:hypothetical protein